MNEVPQAIAGVNGAITFISSLIGLRDFTNQSTDLAKVLRDLVQTNTVLVSIQQAHLAATAKVEELSKECMRLKNWQRDKDEYEICQIAIGVFAYINKHIGQPLENSQKFCCNCFDKTIQSTLQQEVRDEGRGWQRLLICPNGCPPLRFRNYLEQ